MAVLDRIAARLGGGEDDQPKYDLAQIYASIKEPLERGRKEMLKDASKRRLCKRFEEGDTYFYLNEKNQLNAQATVTHVTGGGKPRHRMRNKYNMIRPLVEDKISASTSRVPGYEILATTTDPEDITAAAIAERVAVFGYDQWRIRAKSMKVIKSAIVQGDGFALAYFDPDVGPFRNVDGKWVGEGEIKILTLTGNEVYWEAGAEFTESKWWAVERARSMGDVKKLPGFIPGLPLVPDASASDIPNDRTNDEKLVMHTEIFERPCPKYPDGRRLHIANKRIICDARLVSEHAPYPWETYPLRGVDGKALDEPVLQRLSYTIDPESDRDMGLVWQLIDAQRTYQDCMNKLLEWKNRCLNPQMMAALNSMIDRPTDEPGKILYYRQGFDKPAWERPPNIPQELFQIMNLMQDAMRYISSYADIQADPRVSGTAISAADQHAQSRWESFLGDLAEFHSRLMRQCLLLVARFYTEPRLLAINGRFGHESIADFQGAQLNGQVNVRVNPGSMQYRTRQDILNRLQFLAATFPGFLTPQSALGALDSGAAEKLIESYELDVAKANRIIRRIIDGSVMSMPTRRQKDPTGQPTMVPAPLGPDGQPQIDPATGQPALVDAEVPSWMPEDGVDNLDIWQQIFSDWAKTPDYERMDPGRQEIVKQILQGIRDLQSQAAMRDAQMQAQMAEGMGMANAAAPQQGKPLPSQPKLGAP